MADGSGGIGKENGGGGGGSSSSSPSVINDRSLPRANTMPSGTKNSEISETSTGQQNFERSKTERRRQNLRTDPTAQLFDDKMSDKKKLKMLNRIATVKHDGTVVVEVPSNIEPLPLDIAPVDTYGEAADEEPLETDLQYIPPLQIVMLIVGTRGDVQPFVAIEIPIQRKQLKEIYFLCLPPAKDPEMDSGIPSRQHAINCESPGIMLSYQIVDSMIWLGIRDMINEFRKKKLKLRPVTYLSGAQGSASDIPHGYIWSPHLVPKPKDWGPRIDVVGFCFLDLASNYEPPEELVKWLEADEEKPIYVGFGSLPVQEPEKMTQIIVEALETTKQRGIINKGWGGLGNLAEPKKSIYLLDNVPHDWLFLRCKAVVHHGGAGTTAAGLKAACPTTIVPFFGDQPFWGDRVHARGVGPAPIPVDQFSLPKLVDAINYMLNPKVKEQAVELAEAMKTEDGVTGAVKAFFKHLPKRSETPERPVDYQPSPIEEILGPVRKCFGCS
ncbi:uncharacterized protein A4U43_C04F3180 [Asparagus officinalis]|uniref:Erythromycin biosynthesis protein CIII-like C-terminal domain-containing protein n=1 Tax=Asparagus officinalis TaxID=4686 RepID=A0A5P1F3C4_ASPOF|nr:uncharacterized protein A4U43_C04F3180 [Asparagus officinalis]